MFKVWIDQDLCTGVGVCADICPEVFTLGDDGLAYVRSQDALGTEGRVPHGFVDALVDAAEACPQECIFVELSEVVDPAA